MKNRILAAITVALFPVASYAHVTAEPHAETFHHILETALAHPFESVLMLAAAVGAVLALHYFFNGRA